MGQPQYLHTKLTLYSSFEEKCRDMVNYSLTSRKIPLKKFNTKGKMPPEYDRHQASICLDTWISDTSDPTDLNTE